MKWARSVRAGRGCKRKATGRIDDSFSKGNGSATQTPTTMAFSPNAVRALHVEKCWKSRPRNFDELDERNIITRKEQPADDLSCTTGAVPLVANSR